MKRDIDLARSLLLDIESEGQDCAINRLRNGVVPEGVAAESSDRVRYHLRLLIDAGLVKEVDRASDGVPCVRLTYAGHEMIELARSDVRWRDAKQHARHTTGGLSMGVVRAVLARWAVEGAAVRRYRAPRRLYRPYYHRVEPRRRYDIYREPVTREPVLREPIVREPVARDAVASDPLFDPAYDAVGYTAGYTGGHTIDDLQLVRTRPDYRERPDYAAGYDYAVRQDYVVRPTDAYTPYYTSRYTGERPTVDDAYHRETVDRYGYATEGVDPDTGASLPVYLV